jgi:hypothetical protein
MPHHRIPLPQAGAELTERIRLGQDLLTEVGSGSLHGPQQKVAWDEAVRWHDYNRAWLGNRNPPSKRDILPKVLPLEIAGLTWIRERLPQWLGAGPDPNAVVAFVTPDERVGPWDRGEPSRLQARPNVLIEAGMALATHPRRTIFAVLGPQDLPSDLAGRLYIRLSPTEGKPLRTLAGRLRGAGCDVDLGGAGWLDPSRFPDRGSPDR